MNYTSQLRGWAIDRVIKLYEAQDNGEATLESLQADANILAAFAYVPAEDLETTAKGLFELVRNAADGEAKIDALIGTLEHIKEDRERQGLDKPKAEAS